jgi:hypothetical protein
LVDARIMQGAIARANAGALLQIDKKRAGGGVEGM